MILSVRLFAPLRFAVGSELGQMELEQGIKSGALLERLERAGVLGGYGRHALLVMTNNKVIQDDYVIEEGQTVEIMLNPGGG